MVTQQITKFKVEVTDVLNDGFIGKNEDLKRDTRIQDKSLLENKFSSGDKLAITIDVIDEKDVKKDKNGKEFYVAINQFSGNGFYTKAVKEYDNWKRIFLYEARGMLMFPDDEWERLEINDIIKVSIKKANGKNK